MSSVEHKGAGPNAEHGASPAFETHDHGACVSDALSAAEKLCADRGAQFTRLRRRVLEILWESHRPIGAYALLDRLRAEGLGSQPPTVYRALDFLIEHGLAHKVMKMNAFAACCRPGEPHEPHFLICTGCERISEIADPAVDEALSRAAAQAGFAATEAALELSGLCPSCAKGSQGEGEARR